MTREALRPGEVLPTPEATAPQRGGKSRRTTSGRFAVINAFVDAGMRSLSLSELATWLVLWRDERQGLARTSAGAIAKRAGLSRRSVAGAMKTLRGRGMLVLIHQGGLNRGSSVYRLRPVGDEHEKQASQ